MGIDQIVKWVGEGRTTAEIAASLGVSKRTFLRRKKADSILSAAYDAAFLARRGSRLRKSAPGRWVLPEKPKPAGSPEERILNYLSSNRGADFYSIARGAQVSAEELSEALAKLIVTDRSIRIRRDGEDRARYFINNDIKTSSTGFNRSASARTTAGASA